MHADLALHVAVGVRADDLERHALEAGFEVRLLVHVLDGEAVLLRPSDVHAVEDFGPVAGIGAAGPGLDGDDGVGRVVLAAHHRLQLERLVLLLGLGQRRFDLGLERRIVLGQFGHRLDLAGRGGQFLVGLEQGVGDLQLTDDAAGLLLVVPEVRVRACLASSSSRALSLAGDVKESPAAG